MNYLDDYISIGKSFEECSYVQSVLIHLLHYLGLRVSWKKCTGPSTATCYLGILFDSIRLEVCLPEEKLLKLKSELEFFKGRTRATFQQIQRLCGILSHCARVVRGGHTFSHRIISIVERVWFSW